MRSYSSGVMLCWASNSGVTTTGSGTAADVAWLVIAYATIVARKTLSGATRQGAGQGIRGLHLGHPAPTKPGLKLAQSALESARSGSEAAEPAATAPARPAASGPPCREGKPAEPSAACQPEKPDKVFVLTGPGGRLKVGSTRNAYVYMNTYTPAAKPACPHAPSSQALLPRMVAMAILRAASQACCGIRSVTNESSGSNSCLAEDTLTHSAGRSAVLPTAEGSVSRAKTRTFVLDIFSAPHV